MHACHIPLPMHRSKRNEQNSTFEWEFMMDKCQMLLSNFISNGDGENR